MSEIYKNPPIQRDLSEKTPYGVASFAFFQSEFCKMEFLLLILMQ